MLSYSGVEFVLVEACCGHQVRLLRYDVIAVSFLEVSHTLGLPNIKSMIAIVDRSHSSI